MCFEHRGPYRGDINIPRSLPAGHKYAEALAVRGENAGRQDGNAGESVERSIASSWCGTQDYRDFFQRLLHYLPHRVIAFCLQCLTNQAIVLLCSASNLHGRKELHVLSMRRSVC